MKSREEVEELKRSWAQDPIMDIEETEGFEEYREELLAFREQKEREWATLRWRESVEGMLLRNRVTAIRRYHFRAEHELPHVPETHPFRHMHGHSYTLEVHVSGPVKTAGPEKGMVLDFGKLDVRWEELKAQLTAGPLNTVVDNPTVEEMAPWLWEHFHRVAWEQDERCFTRVVLREDDNAAIFPPYQFRE